MEKIFCQAIYSCTQITGVLTRMHHAEANGQAYLPNAFAM